MQRAIDHSSAHSRNQPLDGNARAEAEAILRRVLKSSPQDLWLDTIRRTRPARHDSLVHWMLGQAECDFAVAVHAFYRSDPIRELDRLQTLPARPGPHEIFAQVLLNWDTGSYRVHRLRVQAVDAHPDKVDRLRDRLRQGAAARLPFRIPDRFLNPVGGTPLHLPTRIAPSTAAHLWPLYDALGLDVPPTPPGISRQLARLRAALNWMGLRNWGGRA